MASPRPITIMPSVMMKGGRRPSVMPAPLIAPSATPMPKPGEDDQRHRHAELEQQRRDDRGDRDDRADREVDAGGQDDEGHADRDDAEQRHLARDVDEVEGLRKASEISAAATHIATSTQTRPEARSSLAGAQPAHGRGDDVRQRCRLHRRSSSLAIALTPRGRSPARRPPPSAGFPRSPRRGRTARRCGRRA